MGAALGAPRSSSGCCLLKVHEIKVLQPIANTVGLEMERILTMDR